MAGSKDCPQTPDGRYFVAKGRLWRRTDPALADGERRALVKQLMQARLAVRKAALAGEDVERAARERVHAAKVALGERGPVWWDDGAPDESQRSPQNSSYADWWAALSDAERARGL